MLCGCAMGFVRMRRRHCAADNSLSNNKGEWKEEMNVDEDETQRIRRLNSLKNSRSTLMDCGGKTGERNLLFPDATRET